MAAGQAVLDTAQAVVQTGESTRDVGGNLGTAQTGQRFASRLLQSAQ